MFERLPSCQSTHLDPWDTALTAFSLFLHASIAGALLLASWLALPAILLPRLRPILVMPVTFPPAGKPAPKLGSRLPSTPRPATHRPVSTPAIPERPGMLPPPSEDAPASRSVEEEASLTGPQPGDPAGLAGGDSHGSQGGACAGEGCDPQGPVGTGPGSGGSPDPDGSSDIFRPGFLDVTAPVLVESSKILPRYPELARRAGVTGRVILEAIIQADGSVAAVSVLQEAPPGLGFAQAARDAVSRWRYQPATQHGIPVAVYFTVTVRFDLSR